MLPFVVTFLVLVVLALIYLTYVRPWQLHWGASGAEILRSIAGDEIVTRPSFNATRAVTIHASPEAIYPWIVQMGVTRAGWYSYDVLDNLARPSADRILPRFQHIQAGDLIPISPNGKAGMFVKEFRNNAWILWWDKKGDSTWAWEIYPAEEGSFRLLTRVRVKYRLFSPTILFSLLIEFFDIVMMRKCMLGIKNRAEQMELNGKQDAISTTA